MKCLNCNKELIGQRSIAKFCSTKCRVAYYRKVTVTQTDEVSVTNPLNKSLSVTKPQVKIKTKSYSQLTEDEMWEEADKMAVREYLSRGYFGGKRSYKSNEIKYFPFMAVKEQFFKFLKEGQDKVKLDSVKEVAVAAEHEWHEFGKCENCFKQGELSEVDVPSYDKETGDMLELKKKICKRCQANLKRIKSL